MFIVEKKEKIQLSEKDKILNFHCLLLRHNNCRFNAYLLKILSMGIFVFFEEYNYTTVMFSKLLIYFEHFSYQ